MTDIADRPAPTPRSTEHVGGLAAQALSIVRSNRTPLRAGADAAPSEAFVAALGRAICQPNDSHAKSVIAAMMDAGIRPEDIIDIYITRVARDLGAAWCEDELGFADVTIGTARLQSLLRELSPATHRVKHKAPSILMIVIGDEFHTLGATMATEQLRRSGNAVRLMMGHSNREILMTVETGEFDAIFLSAALTDRLGDIRELIREIRAEMPKRVPIILGGSIAQAPSGLKEKTGADHVATDPNAALGLCGLTGADMRKDHRVARG